ncbi:MAG: helix-turn-helix domain-containing protein [Bacteroidetes bacterium]|nr:helix-turn-helix domain-containing protein [Bacteroidota bacterium]
MYSHFVESDIPKYSLSETSSELYEHFMIKRLDGVYRQHPAIFLEPHRKDYYMFVLVEQGSSRHWVDMVPYVLKPDTFYFSVPPQVHVKEQAQPLTGIMLCFTDDFLAIDEDQSLLQLPIIRNPYNGHELVTNAESLRFISDIMNKMLAEDEQQADWRHGMLMAYLRVLLIYLSRLYVDQYSNPQTQRDRALLHRFREFIGENYDKIHDVAAYANLLNITPGYLNEIVKLQSGKTAIGHIHERLLLEAKRLLFHSDNSIKEIAFSLGFEDASYFNRFFKRMDGQTPLLYRVSSREMYQ